jgi:hypothetical protein
VRRALALTAALTAGCVGAAPATADRIAEPIRQPAPALPRACEDAQRTMDVTLPQARRTLVVFSSDWCDACERLLAMLSRERGELARRQVAVLHVVTDGDGSCVRAARVGRRAPFAYASARPDDEARWAIRSTPTIWILGPAQRETLAYIEGEPPAGALWAWLE